MGRHELDSDDERKKEPLEGNSRSIQIVYVYVGIVPASSASASIHEGHNRRDVRMGRRLCGWDFFRDHWLAACGMIAHRGSFS